MNYDSHEIAARTQQAETIIDTFTLVWRAGKRVVTTMVDLTRAGVSYISRRLHND